MSFLLVPAIGSSAERVGDFSLLDHDGYHHSMSWYDDHQSIALLVQANGDEGAAASIPAFEGLKAEYDSQGIEFMMINPLGKGNREAVQAQVLRYGVETPVLMDDTRLISEALGIAHIGEVLLFDPKSFTVEYRGAIAGVESAIKDILAGNDVITAEVAVMGTVVSYATTEVPSYTADIAPVLAEQCASCHREGGVAPKNNGLRKGCARGRGVRRKRSCAFFWTYGGETAARRPLPGLKRRTSPNWSREGAVESKVQTNGK